MKSTIHRRRFLQTSIAAAGALVGWRPLQAESTRSSGANVVEKTFTYKTVGGLDVQADVWRADDAVMRPLLLWIHGGALIMGNRHSMDRRMKQAFLDAGYAIASIDYRLAPESKLPEIIQDVEDAYTWAHEKGPDLFHADTRRVAVMGGSAGGYLTLTTGFRVKPRPAVLVSFWGYGDLIADWYTRPSDFYRKQPLVAEADALKGFGTKPVADGSIDGKQRGKFYLYCRQNGLWTNLVTGFDPKTEADKIQPYEPARNVTPDYPPTMLIHGTVDTDVPFEQSVEMAEAFKKHNVEHQLITVPDAGHGLASGDPNLIDDAYAQVFPFVDKHVRSKG